MTLNVWALKREADGSESVDWDVDFTHMQMSEPDGVPATVFGMRDEPTDGRQEKTVWTVKTNLPSPEFQKELPARCGIRVRVWQPQGKIIRHGFSRIEPNGAQQKGEITIPVVLEDPPTTLEFLAPQMPIPADEANSRGGVEVKLRLTAQYPHRQRAPEGHGDPLGPRPEGREAAPGRPLRDGDGAHGRTGRGHLHLLPARALLQARRLLLRGPGSLPRGPRRQGPEEARRDEAAPGPGHHLQAEGREAGEARRRRVRHSFRGRRGGHPGERVRHRARGDSAPGLVRRDRRGGPRERGARQAHLHLLGRPDRRGGEAGQALRDAGRRDPAPGLPRAGQARAQGLHPGSGHGDAPRPRSTLWPSSLSTATRSR